MSDIGKNALKTKIDAKIYDNESQLISGTILNEVLQDAVDTLADGGNLDEGSVDTANLKDEAVTKGKLAQNVSTDLDWAVASNSYYRNSQAGNVAAKEITTNKNMSLIGGGSLKVTFEQANTANDATLNIDGTGAKPLYYNGKRVSSTNSWEANETVEIYYNNYNSGIYYAKRWMVEPVSVSQNNQTGHTNINIGGESKQVPSLMDINNINQYLFGYNGLETFIGNIDSNDNAIKEYGQSKYFVLNVKGGDVVTIPWTGKAKIAIVKSYIPNPELPYNLDYATGETSVRTSAADLVMPNDARFIIVLYCDVYGVRIDYPTLVINGVDIISSLLDKIEALTANVDINNGEIAAIKETIYGITNKTVNATSGVDIYDSAIGASYQQVDIKKGESFTCQVIDTNNILSNDNVGAFKYFYGDGQSAYLLPAGITPNTVYTFVAPEDITALSFGRGGQYVVSSGKVIFRIIAPSELDRLDAKIDEESKRIDTIVSTDEYKPAAGDIAGGLIITTNALLSNLNWKTVYIPIAKDETIQYNTSSTERFYVGFTTELPALNVAITGYDYWSSGILRTITSQVDGYFCVSVKNEYNVQFYVKNDSMELRLEAVEEEVFKPQNDYEVDCASHVFGVYNGVSGKEYFAALYPEGLLQTKLPIRINGKKKELIQILCGSSTPITAGEITENKIIALKGDGYANKELSFVFHKANPKNVQNKNIHILTIGDSIRALITGLTSDNTDVASWAGWMKRMSIENNEIFGNINLDFIGTTNKEQGSYQGQSYVVYGEGRGGWSTYGYINWPIEQRFYDPTNPTTRFNAEEGYYALGLATKTPYCSSVAGRAWTDFDNGDTTQKDVICTPFGRFKPDYCAALWIGCKKYSAFTGTGDWVDTAENRAKIDALFALWVSDAQSPFFDIVHARAHTGTDDAPIWTNPSGFSIAKYLERYRTCDDLGVTLVGSAGETVTGSDGNQYTIGTKVTNTSEWNVCTPTHIIEMLGTNDANSSADNRIEVQKLLLAELTAYGVKSAYFIPRRVGVFYPEDWQNEGMTRPISEYWLSRNYPYVKGIRQFIGDLDASKIVNYIPVYNTMSPFGSAYVTKKCIDMDYADNVKLLTGTDDLHPNGVQLRSIALQALGWLYWSEM